jgi:small subunit ribosomal protein S6
MTLYESVFIARQDISTQDVDKLSEKFSKVITDLKGKIIKKEYWGLRTLAYLLKKNRKGHYVMFGIDASPEAMAELQRQFSLNEDVIRNMTIKVANIDKATASIMMRPAGEKAPERPVDRSERYNDKRKGGDE